MFRFKGGVLMIDDKTSEYAYSLNEEDWEDGGTSPESAIEAATFAVSDRTGDNEHCDYKAGDVVEVWIGRCVKKAPGYYVRGEAEYVIERAGECAGDDVGDYAEDWPLASKEQTAELDESIRAVFEAWCVKHKLEPTFYSIVDVQKHEVVAVGEDDEATP